VGQGMLRTRPLRWPAVLPGWSFFIFYLFVLPFFLIKNGVFIHTFSLMKKYSKNQGRTMLLPTGLYAGPPFCLAFLLVI
jgi:hypothetical protein